SAPLKPERQPRDFALRQRTDSKRAGKQSSRKTAAESGWKQDVSNRPLRTSAKAVLSRSDLGGVPTERRS
ncbi:hypothetical protein, partial [Desulfitobacterium sp. PCE1]|uniref:hypothetical protein n=1 Tax=Desulfitobacterium sp. PCE1 TaxID=146907 RepID=UPI0009FF7702